MNCLWNTTRSICSERSLISEGSTVVLSRLRRLRRALSELPTATVAFFSFGFRVPFTASLLGAAVPLALAQRAVTAFRALWLRCSGVNTAARAGPPLIPPFRPSATAAAFLRFIIRSYVIAHEYSRDRPPKCRPPRSCANRSDVANPAIFIFFLSAAGFWPRNAEETRGYRADRSWHSADCRQDSLVSITNICAC